MVETRKPRHPALQQDGHGFWRFFLKLEVYKTANTRIPHPKRRNVISSMDTMIVL
jgi:hypothetical protein